MIIQQLVFQWKLLLAQVHFETLYAVSETEISTNMDTVPSVGWRPCFDRDRNDLCSLRVPGVLQLAIGHQIQHRKPVI